MYGASQRASTRTGSAPFGVDLVALSVAILLLNLPLFAGQVPSAFLLTSAAMSGEWWRWLTHPFVHVSLYHAALDVCAFLSLYAALPRGSRALCAGAALIGSTVAALVSGGIPVAGFCGLSGAGHGMMAALALEYLRAPDRANRWLGGAAFVLVAGKALIEALSGSVFFASWHWGDVGSPVAACHAGGVLGGAVAAYFFRRRSRIRPR